MKDNCIFKILKCATFIIILLVWLQRPVVAASVEPIENWVNTAAERTNAIKALPAKAHINTLDGKIVSLEPFFVACRAMFPWCSLFEKFYYWENEIREILSDSPNGKVKHKIRCYHNCLSTICPQRCDPLKTHGDVAEFYDAEGNFMGIAVYMGKGKYCSLPYSDYQR